MQTRNDRTLKIKHVEVPLILFYSIKWVYLPPVEPDDLKKSRYCHIRPWFTDKWTEHIFAILYPKIFGSEQKVLSIEKILADQKAIYDSYVQRLEEANQHLFSHLIQVSSRVEVLEERPRCRRPKRNNNITGMTSFPHIYVYRNVLMFLLL